MASIGSFILSIFGIRTLMQNFITVPDEPYLDFDPASFTVTWDGANERNVVRLNATTPVLGAATVTSLTLSGQPSPLLSGPYTLTTTDAAAHTLATIALSPAQTARIRFAVIANLGAGPNANCAPTVYELATVAARIGSGAAGLGAAGDTSAVSKPFVNASSPVVAPGSAGLTVSGNSVLLRVAGFAIKEAWTTGHTYAAGNGATIPGDFVTNAGGIYLCTTGGVAGASAPTGTGTGISDGTDVWTYVGPASGSAVTVTWTLVIDGLVTG